jgi:predicted peptidase
MNQGEGKAGRQQSVTFYREARRRIAGEYLCYLPRGYEDDGRPWPLLLFLHGMGERGRDLVPVTRHGPPKLVQAGKDLPFVLVSPQCPPDRYWETEQVIAVLDDAMERWRIDVDRVYLTGLSMGGYGTWRVGSECPERFAALAPVCGGGPVEWALGVRSLPVWVFHGALDETVPISESETMVAALKEKGADVTFTVYPDTGHDAWTETYANPDLYAWFLSHRRRAGCARGSTHRAVPCRRSSAAAVNRAGGFSQAPEKHRKGNAPP